MGKLFTPNKLLRLISRQVASGFKVQAANHKSQDGSIEEGGGEGGRHLASCGKLETFTIPRIVVTRAL